VALEDRRISSKQTPRAALTKTGRFAAGLLWLVIVAALLVRIHAVTNVKEGLTHDESIAWLCAAAGESRFAAEMPGLANRPVPAAEFQAFLQRPASFAFRTVARDLALTDIHPPLFFWALHVHHVLFGLTPQNQSAINLGLALVTLGLVYRLGRRLSGSHWVGLVCAAVWFCSPAVMSIEFQTRHYSLFAFLVLLALELGDRIIAGERALWVTVMFSLVCGAGMLTHYFFVITMVPGALMVLAIDRLGGQTRRYFAAGIVAVGIFLVLYPEFFGFLRLKVAARPAAAGNAGTFAPAALMKTKAIAFGVAEYFTTWRSLYPVYAIALLSALSVGCIRVAQHRTGCAGNGSGWLTLRNPKIRYAVVLGWFVAFTAILYLVGVSPVHASRGQYFSYIWPLATVFLFLLVRDIVAPRVAIGCLMFHLLQSMASWPGIVDQSFELKPAMPTAWTEACDWSGTVITNDLRRGELLRNTLDLRPDLPVVALSDVSAVGSVRVNDVVALILDSPRNVSPQDIRKAMEEHQFRQRGPELDAVNERTSQWDPMTLTPWRRGGR
jgi:hypothetical protein